MKGAHGKVRYHDGTMYFASKDRGGKTVVLYHGNGTPRAASGMAQKYLERGYNVLLSSYAGDLVVSGNGESHSYKGTACSERAMIEDAKADVEFLSSLNVQQMAVEGWSLGGAQAMNFARAVANLPQSSTVRVDSVVLASAFTNVREACQN